MVGEYISNMFWIVGIVLIVFWVVVVVFMLYLGVKMLFDFKKVEGGYDVIYDILCYNCFCVLFGCVIVCKWLVVGVVVGFFVLVIVGMVVVKK